MKREQETVEEFMARGGQVTELPYLVRKHGPEKKRRGNRAKKQGTESESWRDSYQKLKGGGFSA